MQLQRPLILQLEFRQWTTLLDFRVSEKRTNEIPKPTDMLVYGV